MRPGLIKGGDARRRLFLGRSFVGRDHDPNLFRLVQKRHRFGERPGRSPAAVPGDKDTVKGVLRSLRLGNEKNVPARSEQHAFDEPFGIRRAVRTERHKRVGRARLTGGRRRRRRVHRTAGSRPPDQAFAAAWPAPPPSRHPPRAPTSRYWRFHHLPSVPASARVVDTIRQTPRPLPSPPCRDQPRAHFYLGGPPPATASHTRSSP